MALSLAQLEGNLNKIKDVLREVEERERNTLHFVNRIFEKVLRAEFRKEKTLILVDGEYQDKFDKMLFNSRINHAVYKGKDSGVILSDRRDRLSLLKHTVVLFVCSTERFKRIKEEPSDVFCFVCCSKFLGDLKDININFLEPKE